MLTKLFYRFPKPYRLLLIGLASALIAIAVGVFTVSLLPANESATSPSASSESTVSNGTATGDIPANASPSEAPSEDFTQISPLPNTVPSNTVPTAPIPAESQAGSPNPAVANSDIPEPYDDVVGNQFNHLPYAEAPQERIVPVGLFVREGYEREETLDYEATQAFLDMAAAARAEGVILIPISGFRTISRQQELFDNQVEKLGSSEAAAKLSAPPGYSEHHTGYAIDIGDESRPDTDIKYEFENTAAYGWLLANAGRHGFELSFPKGNAQGVSFEPWHWRFVDSPGAQQTFYP